MRTRKGKIGICMVVSIMAAGLLGSTAMAQVYTDPVGFVKVDVYRNGYTMISVPLRASDTAMNGVAGCIGDIFEGVLLGASSAGEADAVLKWDAASVRYGYAWLVDGWGVPYDGTWQDPDTGVDSTMTFEPGEACWVLRMNQGAEVETITFLGWVPMEETKTLSFIQGLNMFNWPYPTTLGIDASGLGAVSTAGGSAGEADVVWQWDTQAETYTIAFLVTGWGAPYDGNWYDPNTSAIVPPFTSIEFGPGKAFWFQRQFADPVVWVCSRPY